MKITLIGCGSIGKLWLAALHQQQHEVQGWLRLPKEELSLYINNVNGDTFNQVIASNDLAHLKASQLIIVCLKAWQVSAALNPLSDLIATDCPILLLHNGMGTLDELQFNQHPLLAGTTTHAAWQDNHQVFHVAQGITHIGAVNQPAQNYSYIADILHQALPDVAWHNQIITTCWQKLAVNCVINPLTVLYDCHNGELLNYSDQIQLLIHEIYQVMVAEGLYTEEQSLSHHINRVITDTHQNFSSMLQDVRNQRRTEIDYITGYLLKRARLYGINTPENDRIYHLIKYREQHYDSFGTGLSG